MNAQDKLVLDYYAREALEIIETRALAGLSLSAFRAARTRLLARGELVRLTNGRYQPLGATT